MSALRPGDAPDEEFDTGGIEPGFGGRGGGFEVLGQPPVPTKPCEGSLDNPPPGQDDETLGLVASADDLQGSAADLLQRAAQLLPGIAAVCEDVAQPGERLGDGSEHIGRAIPVLDVCPVHRRPDQHARGVGHDVPLAALLLLARIIATLAIRLGRLGRLAVDHPGAGAGLASSLLPRPHQEQMVQPLPVPSLRQA